MEHGIKQRSQSLYLIYEMDQDFCFLGTGDGDREGK